MDYIWDMRNPDGGMLGMEFARGRSEACEVIIVHSPPEKLDVVVRDPDENVVAVGKGLEGSEPTPMSRLRVADGHVTRESIWPGEEDIGRLVILPGGEIGILKSWWNADDHSEWRWEVEFHNTA